MATVVKYDIGQEIWYLCGVSVKKDYITAAHINGHGTQYQTKNFGWVAADSLFCTEGEVKRLVLEKEKARLQHQEKELELQLGAVQKSLGKVRADLRTVLEQFGTEEPVQIQ